MVEICLCKCERDAVVILSVTVCDRDKTFGIGLFECVVSRSDTAETVGAVGSGFYILQKCTVVV